MEFTNENILKYVKRQKRLIIIGIIFLAFSFLLFSLSIKQNEKDNKNIKYLNEIIESNSESDGQKAYLNVRVLSEAFAAYDDTTDAYYYVSDGDYYYIVYLTKEKYNEISKEDLSIEPYKLYGIARYIKDDVKKIIVEDWNSTLEEGDEELTNETLFSYFGDVYLDGTSLYSENAVSYIVFGTLIFILGLVLTLVGIIKKKSITSSMKRLDSSEIMNIENEMMDSNSFYYKNVGIYLTNNYLIVINSQFKVYKYNEILWMYKHENFYNGIKTSQSITIFTSDGKTSNIATIALSTKNQKEIFDEIWNTLINKNPNLLVGYTKENIDHFKEVKKEIKNNKY